MYRVFLVALLLLNCNFLFGQELANKINRAGISEASAFRQAGFNDKANDLSFSVVDRASAGSRPRALIYDEFLICYRVSGNISLRCNRDVKTQRETRKRDGRAVGMIGHATECDGADDLADKLVRKRIWDDLTSRYISITIVLAFTEQKPPNPNLWRSTPFAPRCFWNIDRWNARPELRVDLIPTRHYMASRKEIAFSVDEKTSSYNPFDFPFLFFIELGANDRDNRPLDGVYCFDGHAFRFIGRQGHCQERQDEKENNSHGYVRLRSGWPD